MYGVFGGVVDVVDANPDGDEGAGWVDDVLEHRVAVLLVLYYLIDEGDGVVVVQGSVFNGDVRSSKGKVPKLLFTAEWGGQPFLDATIC